MKKEYLLMLLLLTVPLVSAMVSPNSQELAQINYNNGIFVIILVVGLVLIAIIYYLLTKKNLKKKKRKKNGKKRSS